MKSTLDYSMESCATYFIIIIIINAITITTTITSAIAIVNQFMFIHGTDIFGCILEVSFPIKCLSGTLCNGIRHSCGSATDMGA